MRTSSLGRREQEVQEKRKRGRAGASTARSSVKHCKQSKSCKSNGEEREQEHEHRAEQQRKTSKSIHSCKLARLDDRVWALARALRARARPASRWEHLVSLLCFLQERGGMSRRIRCFLTVPSRFMLQNIQNPFISALWKKKERERERTREKERERERTREKEIESERKR